MRLTIILVVVCLVSQTAFAQVTCPKPSEVGGVWSVVFPDGSMAVRAPLAVNPDGAKASYTVGDHGATYINNGLALWENGRRVECSAPAAAKRCQEEFARAERENFAKGTAEFCVFAMEVVPPNGQPLTKCQSGNVAGNGKGSIKIGGELENVAGGKTPFYSSMTAIMHTAGGRTEYLNSAAIPSVVLPRSSASGLGQVVWVRHPGTGSEVYAIAGDIGPKFGEGSIALHQLLRNRELSEQKIGPIPVNLRCTPVEHSLVPPFVSRPDLGSGDQCRDGYTAKGPADIRAYSGITTPIDFVVLGKARFPLTGNVVAESVDTAKIRQKATDANYTSRMIRQMFACLDAN